MHYSFVNGFPVKRDPGASDWCEQFPKVSFYSRWLDYDTDE